MWYWIPWSDWVASLSKPRCLGRREKKKARMRDIDEKDRKVPCPCIPSYELFACFIFLSSLSSFLLLKKKKNWNWGKDRKEKKYFKSSFVLLFKIFSCFCLGFGWLVGWTSLSLLQSPFVVTIPCFLKIFQALNACFMYKKGQKIHTSLLKINLIVYLFSSFLR